MRRFPIPRAEFAVFALSFPVLRLWLIRTACFGGTPPAPGARRQGEDGGETPPYRMSRQRLSRNFPGSRILHLPERNGSKPCHTGCPMRP